MSSNFNRWKSIYDSEDFISFSKDKEALLWLKIKSVVRKKIITEFCSENKIVLKETSLTKQFEELFNKLSLDINESHKKLDTYILSKNAKILKELHQEKLVSELYKLQNFEWGGDYQNSLDKYLISHYVKNIKKKYYRLTKN